MKNVFTFIAPKEGSRFTKSPRLSKFTSICRVLAWLYVTKLGGEFNWVD